MPSVWEDYRGLQVPSAPTGDAGINLREDLEILRDSFDTLLAANGSQSAPSHSFASDTDSGMYSSGANSLAFATGGTNRMLIDGAGNMAVATTTATGYRMRLDNSSTVTSGTVRGVNVNASLTPSATTTASLLGVNVDLVFAGSQNSSAFCYAARYSSEVTSSGTLTLLAGSYSDAFVNGNGSVANAYGMYNQLYLFGGSGGITNASVYYARSSCQAGASGTISRLAHFHSVAPNKGGGSITNFVGLWVENSTSGTSPTNNTHIYLGGSSSSPGIPSGNWAIYSSVLLDSSIQGLLTVQSKSSSTVALVAKGAASQTANLQEWQNSSGSVLVQFDASGGAVFNEQGNNADFRIEGDTNANLFAVDASADSIGIGTSTPSAKALMEFSSTTQGVLLPRMTTTQRDAISGPPAGLMIYNSTTNKLNFYNGSAWEAVTST